MTVNWWTAWIVDYVTWSLTVDVMFSVSSSVNGRLCELCGGLSVYWQYCIVLCTMYCTVYCVLYCVLCTVLCTVYCTVLCLSVCLIVDYVTWSLTVDIMFSVSSSVNGRLCELCGGLSVYCVLYCVLYVCCTVLSVCLSVCLSDSWLRNLVADGGRYVQCLVICQWSAWVDNSTDWFTSSTEHFPSYQLHCCSHWYVSYTGQYCYSSYSFYCIRLSV